MEHIKLFKCLYMYQVTILSLNFVAMETHFSLPCGIAFNSRLKFKITLKAMPHGSEKSPEKNRNEIRHSLCMPHGRVKIVANYE